MTPLGFDPSTSRFFIFIFSRARARFVLFAGPPPHWRLRASLAPGTRARTARRRAQSCAAACARARAMPTRCWQRGIFVRFLFCNLPFLRRLIFLWARCNSIDQLRAIRRDRPFLPRRVPLNKTSRARRRARAAAHGEILCPIP